MDLSQHQLDVDDDDDDNYQQQQAGVIEDCSLSLAAASTRPFNSTLSRKVNSNSLTYDEF